MSEAETSEYVEDLAATMLASTLGVEFDPDAAWDERKRVYELSNLIVDTQSIAAATTGAPGGDWTCVVAVAVFLFSPSGSGQAAMTGAADVRLPPTFLGVRRNDPSAPICVAGIPLDLGTTNRAGARFGPAAIRQASRMLVDGDHPLHWVNPAASGLADIGNFTIALGDIAKSLAEIEQQAARDQAPCRARRRPWHHAAAASRAGEAARRRRRVIHFDAHVDTWPENFGQSYAHGTVFYHAISEGLIEPRRMVQIGIRSPVERGGARLDARAGRGHRSRRKTCTSEGPRQSPSKSAR